MVAPLGIRLTGPAQTPADTGCKIKPPTFVSAAGLVCSTVLCRSGRHPLQRGQAIVADDDVVGGRKGTLLAQVTAKSRRRRRGGVVGDSGGVTDNGVAKVL